MSCLTPLSKTVKSLLLERADQIALRVLHVHQQAHQLTSTLKLGGLRSDGGRGQASDQAATRFHACALTTESSHSPSTHTSPSTKYSFFHTGTSRFRRLMPSSAASNAGLRCGAVDHHRHAGLADLDAAQPVHHARCGRSEMRAAISPPISRHHLDAPWVRSIRIRGSASARPLVLLRVTPSKLTNAPSSPRSSALRERRAIDGLAREREKVPGMDRRSAMGVAASRR